MTDNKELKKEAREEIVIIDGERVDAGTTEWVRRKVNKYIDKATKAATLAERETWLYQKANEHDKRIREDERARCAEVAETKEDR